MPATHGQAAVILATAGKKAAKMAQSIAAASSSAVLRDGPGQFAARISAKQRLASRLHPLQNQIAEMFDSAARTANNMSAAPIRRPLRPELSLGIAPAGITQLTPISERVSEIPQRRALRNVPMLASPGVPASDDNLLNEAITPLPEATQAARRSMPGPASGSNEQQPTESLPDPILQMKRAGMEGPPAHAPAEDAGPIDYRTLGPTPLRDALTRRGGPGAALEYALRERLAGPLKFDPSLARLHRGPVAAEAARTLRAEAFAIGRDVFFGEGRYDPSSKAGLGLLAHELTHVRQQTGRATASMKFFTPSGGDAYEREAQEAAGIVTNQHLQQPASESGSYATPPIPPPTMEYAMPPSRHAAAIGSQTEFNPHGSEQSTGGSGAQTAHDSNHSRAVSDRVYQLMLHELIRDRERGLAFKRG